MWSCWKGYVEVVQTLISHRANVNQLSKNGRSPLMWASHNGFTPIVQALIEAGAEVNAHINDGQTSLTWASRMGHLDTAKLLVESGADAASVLSTLYEIVAVLGDIKRKNPAIAEKLASKYEKLDVPPSPATSPTNGDRPPMPQDAASVAHFSSNEEKHALEEEKDGEIRVPLSRDEMDNMSIMTSSVAPNSSRD